MPSVRTNGIDMHYEERGSGEPLILLMGLGADGPTWEDHVKLYERHFRCILVDNRGAGRSDKPEGPIETYGLGISGYAPDFTSVPPAIVEKERYSN